MPCQKLHTPSRIDPATGGTSRSDRREPRVVVSSPRPRSPACADGNTRTETSADQSVSVSLVGSECATTTPRGGRSDGGGRRPVAWPRSGHGLVARSSEVGANPSPARDVSATGDSTPGSAPGCGTTRLHSRRSRGRDIRADAELQEFAVDSWRAPERIRLRHGSNQLLHVRRHARPT